MSSPLTCSLALHTCARKSELWEGMHKGRSSTPPGFNDISMSIAENNEIMEDH